MSKSKLGLGSVFLYLVIGVFVSSAAAQLNGVVSSSGTFHPGTGTTNHRSMTLEPGMMVRLGPPVTGQPYSGDLESEHSQTLTNGTHINQKREVFRSYRDSQGRTRTERLMFQSLRFNGTQEPAARLVQIYDPVEGYEYTLDTEKHIAHRVPVQTFPKTPARDTKAADTPESRQALLALRERAASTRTNFRQANTKHEPLGTQTIEGVEAEGERITVTTPVGAMGNDKPLVHVCETWHAVELKTLLLSKCSDPRMGHSTLRLANLDRSEPDPTLFMVPSDYTIVDDKDRFTVGFGEPATVNPE